MGLFSPTYSNLLYFEKILLYSNKGKDVTVKIPHWVNNSFDTNKIS